MTASTIRQNKSDKIKRISSSAAVALFWAAVWQGVYFLVDKPVLLPSPSAVLLRLVDLVQTADFWLDTAVSLLRIMLGVVFGVVFGVALSVLTSVSKIAEKTLSPVIKIIRATPVASFILLALVWLKKDSVTHFIVLLMVMPVFWENVCKGVENADKNLLEMSGVFRFGFFKKVDGIYLPSVRPYFAAALSTSLGLGWKAGIAAEVLSVPVRAIGTNIYHAKIYIETTDLFAWTAVAILLSILIEIPLKALAGRLGKV